MYDINKLRKELESNPKQRILLDILHRQIVLSNYAKKIKICLDSSSRYSSKLKKSTLGMLGYTPTCKKLGTEFDIVRL